MRRLLIRTAQGILVEGARVRLAAFLLGLLARFIIKVLKH